MLQRHQNMSESSRENNFLDVPFYFFQGTPSGQLLRKQKLFVEDLGI